MPPSDVLDTVLFHVGKDLILERTHQLCMFRQRFGRSAGQLKLMFGDAKANALYPDAEIIDPLLQTAIARGTQAQRNADLGQIGLEDPGDVGEVGLARAPHEIDRWTRGSRPGEEQFRLVQVVGVAAMARLIESRRIREVSPKPG
jgi:hypothetical protein